MVDRSVKRPKGLPFGVKSAILFIDVRHGRDEHEVPAEQCQPEHDGRGDALCLALGAGKADHEGGEAHDRDHHGNAHHAGGQWVPPVGAEHQAR